MLLRKHSCRRKKCGLLSVHSRDERGAHGDLGLAVTGISADETVHRLGGREIPLHILYRRRLVGSLIILERRLESGDPILLDIVRKTRDNGTLRLRLKQRCRKIGDSTLGVALLLGPSSSIQAVELHLFALHANIARKEMRMGDRHMKFRPICIFDGENFAARFAHLYFG